MMMTNSATMVTARKSRSRVERLQRVLSRSPGQTQRMIMGPKKRMISLTSMHLMKRRSVPRDQRLRVL